MQHQKKIKSALISVFDKQDLKPIVQKLHELGVKIYSTGGTEKYIRTQDIPVIPVESLTKYPSILGGRVKTLHPKIFGGILGRRSNVEDAKQLKMFELPEIDLVIVDLYPFEKTVKSKASEEEIIEKIDIGGISLIRAAAKNFEDVVCISSKNQYSDLLALLNEQNGNSSIEQRKKLAAKGFADTSHYDTMIAKYFNSTEEEQSIFRESINESKELRYGENPHQQGTFFGNLDAMFDKLNGKELSYNNLLDIDAAVNIMEEFGAKPPTFAILKHNNACGLAQKLTIKEAYLAALSSDPVSAFGGILISNTTIDEETAVEIHQLFCEVVIAPAFSEQALAILKEKKNRILLRQKQVKLPNNQFRTALNGVLYQQKDLAKDHEQEIKFVTQNQPTEAQMQDLFFASSIAKHTKSNTIVLVKDKQLLACGTGQTSRVDALEQAIAKARHFKFSLKGAAMASDAFFPFADCVALAQKAGIKSIIQPGGSVKDQLSIDYCNKHGLAMIFTGTRHFKH